MSQLTQQQETQPEVSGGAVRITATAPSEQLRIVLFYVGDDAYTVPKRIPANIGLRFLEVAALQGPGVAQVYLMEELLGEEAMAALKGADGMTDENLQELRDKFDDLFAPQVDELLNPKGSRKLSRRSRGY